MLASLALIEHAHIRSFCRQHGIHFSNLLAFRKLLNRLAFLDSVRPSFFDGNVVALYNWIKRHLAIYQIPYQWGVLDKTPRTLRGEFVRTYGAEFCKGLETVVLRCLSKRQKCGAR